MRVVLCVHVVVVGGVAVVVVCVYIYIYIAS